MPVTGHQQVVADHHIGGRAGAVRGPELNHVGVITGAHGPAEPAQPVALDQQFVHADEIHPVHAQIIEIVAAHDAPDHAAHDQALVEFIEHAFLDHDVAPAAKIQTNGPSAPVFAFGHPFGDIPVKHRIADGDVVAVVEFEHPKPRLVTLGIGVIERDPIKCQVLGTAHIKIGDHRRVARIRRRDRHLRRISEIEP